MELRRAIMERATEALDHDLVEGGTVRIHATVNVHGASTGVKHVGDFSLDELYQYSQAELVMFAKDAAQLSRKVTEILQMPEDEVDRELSITALWASLRNWGRFMGISSGHDELIASFQQIVFQMAGVAVSVEQLRAVQDVLQQVSRKGRFSEQTLDRLYERLEAASFDLDPVF